MKVTFDRNIDEQIKAVRAVRRKHGSKSVVWWTAILFAGSILQIIAALHLRWYFFMVIGSLFAGIIVLTVFDVRSERAARRLNKSNVEHPISVTADADKVGFHWVAPTVEFHLEWSAVESCNTTADYLVVRGKNKLLYIIPLAAFVSSDAEEEFSQFIKSHMQAAKN